MTDATQPKPGRALDVLMARVMGWAVYERTEFVRLWEHRAADYPCMVLGECEDNYYVHMGKGLIDSTHWRPSTNLLHAFEVDKTGWFWKMGEYSEVISVELQVETGERNTANWQINYYTSRIFYNKCPTVNGKIDKPAACALARCRAVTAWWKGQGEAT